VKKDLIEFGLHRDYSFDRVWCLIYINRPSCANMDNGHLTEMMMCYNDMLATYEDHVLILYDID